MTLTILTPPAVEPVSLDEAKAHLRVTYPDEDALIGRLLVAARARVEAALGLALVTTGLRETLDAWPVRADGSLELARGPLSAVSAINVGQANGPAVPLDPALYAVDVGSRPGRVRPAVWQGLGWPAPGVAFAGVVIDYTAGFGATSIDVPEPLRQAVLVLAAYAFETRDAGEPDLGLVAPWLAPWRRVRLKARTIALNAKTIDVTDSDSAGRWRELLAGAGVRSASVTGSGVFRDAAADAMIRDAFFAQAAADWQLVVPSFGVLQGPFLIAALDYAGQHDGEATYALTLASAGAVSFTAVQ